MKVLKTAAIIVGVVAMVAGAVSTFGASLGLAALVGTAATVGAISGVVAASVIPRAMTEFPP